MANYKDLADLIFPHINKTIEDLEKRYPERNLPEGAEVTRFAPSPTGFLHTGSLFTCLVSSRFAKQSGGVFYIRLEDTDTKREIEGSGASLVEQLSVFDIIPDEGYISDSKEIGNYGPYKQSDRKELYEIVIKHLVEQGRAYPCFCSAEELAELRKEQEAKKEIPGYYGKYAKYRDFPIDDAIARIKNGDPYIIRFKSMGDHNNKISFHDEIKGDLELTQNDQDIVILKGDGLPTYHFAHLVDDHLMRTTHVIRGDEWVASLPIHVQLFEVFGFKLPTYCHIAPIAKMEDGKVRKISKRKDPEAATSYYHELGVPLEAVKLYLGTLANSGFEPWYTSNPAVKAEEYVFEFSKMSKSPAIFDLDKLNFICKEYMARISAKEVYEGIANYLNEFDKDFYEIFTKNPEYSTAFLNIEREQKKPRKDLAYYSDAKNEMWYMFDELFTNKWEDTEYKVDTEMLKDYITNYYDASKTQQEWFDELATFGAKYNYATTKEYKANPEAYAGSIGNICEMLRYVVTTKHQSPSLYDILKLFGKERILKRIESFK